MKKTFAAMALLAIIFGTTAQSTYACSVVAGYPGTPAQTITAKDIAFIGTVQSVNQAQTEHNEYQITFTTNAVYKGSVPSTITVSSESSSAACGYDDGKGTFTVGSVWMIYATGNATAGYKTNAISLNTKYESLVAAGKALAVAGLIPTTVGPVTIANTTLRIGARGEVVKELQKSLVAHGYTIGVIDGAFGPMTKKAVIQFQASHNLTADGIVGIKTATSLAAQ